VADHVRFTDLVVDDIARLLAAHPPERGGALVAAGGLIHHLVEDPAGGYTHASWEISAELTAAVQAAESAGRGRLAGTVHSHPAATPDPSEQDLRATARLLERNPHLDAAAVCVVTRGDPRPGDLPVGDHHRMSVHLARRAPHGSCRVARATASVATVGDHLATAGARNPAAGRCLVWHGSERLAMALDDDPDPPVLLLVSREYPAAGPIFVTPADSGELTPVSRQPWDPTQPAGSQLRTLLDAASGRRPAGLADRVEGLAGELSTTRVLVAGLGSVGSWLAAELVRAGVEHLDLIDPDHVEGSNLARSIYEARHVETPKASAAAELLAHINPAVHARSHHRTIGELDGHLAELSRQADLIIAATDDPTEQALLGHHAYAAGTPLVACGLYRQARAGEVVVVVPQLDTPCLTCATGASRLGDRGDKDYSTGRLASELALGPPIHLVTEVAAIVAIGLLAGPAAAAGQPLRSLLASRRTVGLISTAPEWDFFPTVFAGLEGNQWAPQSIWASVEASEDCPVCGPERVPPASVSEPGAATVIAQLREEIC
jgi:molybdopterin/thiamine biosynthesis adenylyltransferase/proteasome lid subunit RPN8/RPN11